MAVKQSVKSSYTAYRHPSGSVVHVVRPEVPEKAFCGTYAHPVSNGDPQTVENPAEPLPEGLRWCGSCLGALAERQGRSEELAKSLFTGLVF